MKNHHVFALSAALLILVVSSGEAQFRRVDATGIEKTFDHQGRSRRYRILVPKSVEAKENVSLVVALHGGGGDARKGSAMGLSEVAEEVGFVVAYPEAVERHWNDGRDSVRFREHDAKINDVAFLTALIEHLQGAYSIDKKRTYICGVSNGGFMTQRMAMEKPQLFSAAAVMIATMAEPLNESFAPTQPISIMFMNGTDDPLVKYDGGEVVVNMAPRLIGAGPSRGKGTSTDEAVNLWRTRNKLTDQDAALEQLPDLDPTDGSVIERSLWSGGEQGTAVMLYKVKGGGHSIPGMRQYLPERLIGMTNRDANGWQLAWEFFDEYGRE